MIKSKYKTGVYRRKIMRAQRLWEVHTTSLYTEIFIFEILSFEESISNGFKIITVTAIKICVI